MTAQLSQKSNSKDASKLISKEYLLRDYKLRMRDALRSLNDNFSELLRLSKVDDELVSSRQVNRNLQYEQEYYEMQVRAANMARAGESLLKLINDIKEYLIINDFDSVDTALSTAEAALLKTQNELTSRLATQRAQLAADVAALDAQLLHNRQL